MKQLQPQIRALLILCALLASPIAAATDARDEYANIHKVGIISAIGNTLSLTKIGVMVFGNGQKELPIGDWQIDRIVSNEVSTALQRRFTVKPEHIDVSSIESLQRLILGYHDTPDLRSFILALPDRADVDAYVVVTKALAGEGVSLYGLGIYRHPMLFGNGNFYVYAYYQIAVMDSHDGHLIDYGTARLTGGGYLNDPMPIQVLPEADWAETPEALTDQQKGDIKTQLMAMINKSLPVALNKANLISDADTEAMSPPQP